MTIKPKEQLYKTAVATIACHGISIGDCVSVSYHRRGNNGVNWYLINKTEKGELQNPVYYTDKQLTNFCL